MSLVHLSRHHHDLLPVPWSLRSMDRATLSIGLYYLLTLPSRPRSYHRRTTGPERAVRHDRVVVAAVVVHVPRLGCLCLYVGAVLWLVSLRRRVAGCRGPHSSNRPSAHR